MIRLEENAYKGYTLCKMQECDFVFVKDFLDSQRSKLGNIEFFYPYKDDELRAVLSCGYFLGLIDEDKLIATFAVDNDEEYASTLADLINSFDGGNLQRAYESSGLMVAEEYRGRGIAKFMMAKIMDYAKSLSIAICGVVHTRNVASMSTFFSFGFELRAVWHMSEGYDFVYLLYDEGNCENNKENLKKVLHLEKNGVKIKNVEEISNTDVNKHTALFKDGYVGIGCTDTDILFMKKGVKL